MARRKRRGCKNNKKNTAKMTLQDRETSVKNALRYGHFKKAIVHLKPLLKSEKRAEWVEWAQTAHNSLAEQLSSEKKFQELFRLLANGHKLCGLSLETPLYINALLNVNRLDEALQYYLSLSKNKSLNNTDDKNNLRVIRNSFAAQAIAGDSKIIKSLPSDDPIVVDFEKANQLLNAYCDSDDETVVSLLKMISFRSPYRDLRQIIAAAIKLNGDNAAIEESRGALAHISPDSAFIVLANQLHLASGDTQEILSSFTSLDVNAQKFVQQMQGWKPEQGKLIKALADLSDEPSFAELFRFADEHKNIQPEYCNDIAKMALIYARTKRNKVVTIKRYEQRFGKFSELEANHQEALYENLAFELGLKAEYRFELEDQLEDLEATWEEYLTLLENSHENKDISLVKALVYRYFVKLYSRGEYEGITAYYLEKSLKYDPMDKESHIRVIRYYLEEKKLKEARNNLTLALKYYPDDLQVLLIAIEVAIAGGAYKKASTYAKAILKVDPINRPARKLLCNAHLSHSRKQAKARKWHLLEKEFKEVEYWGEGEESNLATIAILRASMAVAQKQTKQASDYLQQLRTLATTALNASFMIHLEADSVGADAKKLHRLAKLKWTPAKKQKKDVLFSFLDMSETSLDNYSDEVVKRAVNSLMPALKSIDVKDFSLQDYERVLAFCNKVNQLKLLDSYHDKAVKEYGDVPILTYYHFIERKFLSISEYEEVNDAIDQAKEINDTVMVARLISILDKCAPPSFLGGGGFGNPFGGFDGGFDDDIDDDFNDDGFKLFNNLDDGPMSGNSGEGESLILAGLIRMATTDEEIIQMMGDLMPVTHSDVMKYRDKVGAEGLKEMLIAFLVDKTLPEQFIENYQGKSKGSKNAQKKQAETKDKSEENIQQIRLFGDDE